MVPINTRKNPIRVLLVGYNGANNTGSEALLTADIEDLRAVLGPFAQLTIPTISEANLRRYVRDDNVRIVEWPKAVFPALPGLVRESDLVLLVEGSTYMDTWSPAMLWVYLWTTHLAHAMKKPCLAYAVDAGNVSAFNRNLVRSEASKTDLIIARAWSAAHRLRSMGVRAPVKVTADNAFNFHPHGKDDGWFLQNWPEAASGMVGLAAVNFHLWPVVMRLWGRKKDCYKWPFFFSHSPERDRAVDALADGYAALADGIIAKHDKSIALICMEQLDEPLARMIRSRMNRADRARIFSSREHDASCMTTLLRNLDLLVTSRYHACVLSLAAQVPLVAVGHDLRLKTIFEELNLLDQYFIEPDSPDMIAMVKDRVDSLLADPEIQKQALRQGYGELLGRARQNRRLLADFIAGNLGQTAGSGSDEREGAAPANDEGGTAWAA